VDFEQCRTLVPSSMQIVRNGLFISVVHAIGEVDIPCHPDQSLTSRTFPIPPSCSLSTLRADFGPFFFEANNPLFSDKEAATMTRSSNTNIVKDSSFRLDLLEDGDR
jgi:hypothetical protein